MKQDGSTGIVRDAAAIGALTLVSRATGFVRIVVATAVLGTGLLGDVYQSANTIPNIVFELLAGGALQAALVPLFVAARTEGGDEGLARAVGAIAGTATAVLAAVAAVILVGAPWLARALSAAEPIAAVADDKVHLATWMLVIFSPQVIFYGMGLVSTATLQARGRFVAAAVAPAVNNVVVISAYLLFDAMRGDVDPSLELSRAELVVLAGGTTLAVALFTSVPVVAMLRSTEHPLSWRVSFGDDAVRRVRQVGGWAILQVSGVLLLTAAALVIGNGAPGGVAVYSLATAVFLLPYALLAAPVAVAALPRLAALHQAGDDAAFLALVRRNMVRVTVLTLAAGAALAVCAWPIARAIVFGAADTRGPAPVAHALLAFAPGVAPYGVWFLLSRVLVARGEMRRAAGVSLATAAVGTIAMVVLADRFAPGERAAALALGFTSAHLVGVALLIVAVFRAPRAAERAA